MSSRRSSSSSGVSYRPMIKLQPDSPFYGTVGSRLRGTRKLQHIITCIAIVFVVVSGVISLFGSEPLNDFLLSSLSKTEDHKYNRSSSTSAPSLTPAQRLDRTWSDDRCRKEFPLLYKQLEENALYWRAKGGIKKEMIDFNESRGNRYWGHARLIIRNRKVYIRSFREGTETRNSAMVHLVAMAVQSWPTSSRAANGVYEDILPPIDLILSAADKDSGFEEGGWAVTKPSDGREQGTWLLPDFGFISWPEAGAGYYEDFVDKAQEVEEAYPWSKKHDKMFWRGFPNFYRVRLDLMDRVSTKTDASRKEWSDIHKTTFHKGKEDDSEMFPLVSLAEHCQHKFLIHTEGNSYSGRSKYLFSCRSATIVHPLEWTQHFHPALNDKPHSPNQNYIQLPGPHFSGLQEAAIELRKADAGHSSKVHKYIGRKSPEMIADNAMRTLRDRYLTPASTACYTRAALRSYATSLNVDSFGQEGVTLIPGEGVAPDISKGKTMHHLKGDIEVGVWRLLGAPNWPPEPAPKVTPPTNTTNSMNSSLSSNSTSSSSYSPYRLPSSSVSSSSIEQSAALSPSPIPSKALSDEEAAAIDKYQKASKLQTSKSINV